MKPLLRFGQLSEEGVDPNEDSIWHPDGSIHDIGASIWHLDDSIWHPDGSIYEIDGSIYDIDDPIYGIDDSMWHLDDPIYDIDATIHDHDRPGWHHDDSRKRIGAAEGFLARPNHNPFDKLKQCPENFLRHARRFSEREIPPSSISSEWGDLFADGRGIVLGRSLALLRVRIVPRLAQRFSPLRGSRRSTPAVLPAAFRPSFSSPLPILSFPTIH